MNPSYILEGAEALVGLTSTRVLFLTNKALVSGSKISQEQARLKSPSVIVEISLAQIEQIKSLKSPEEKS